MLIKYNDILINGDLVTSLRKDKDVTIEFYNTNSVAYINCGDTSERDFCFKYISENFTHSKNSLIDIDLNLAIQDFYKK